MRTAIAMLVSGPVGTSVMVPGSFSMMVFTMKLTACMSSSGRVGTGSSTPSRPVWPWMEAATSCGRTSGRSQPAYTGMSVRCAFSSTARGDYNRCKNNENARPPPAAVPARAQKEGRTCLRISAHSNTITGSFQ